MQVQLSQVVIIKANWGLNKHRVITLLSEVQVQNMDINKVVKELTESYFKQ